MQTSPRLSQKIFLCLTPSAEAQRRAKAKQRTTFKSFTTWAVGKVNVKFAYQRLLISFSNIFVCVYVVLTGHEISYENIPQHFCSNANHSAAKKYASLPLKNAHVWMFYDVFITKPNSNELPFET